MSSEALYLLHTQPDPQRLAAWAARHRLLDPQGDLGYALHALLHAAFGEHAPQPFRYLDAAQGLLAYTHLSPVELAQCAALAEPEVAAALGLGQTLHHTGLSARPFPTQWAAGHVLGFEAAASWTEARSTCSGCASCWHARTAQNWLTPALPAISCLA